MIIFFTKTGLIRVWVSVETQTSANNISYVGINQVCCGIVSPLVLWKTLFCTNKNLNV